MRLLLFNEVDAGLGDVAFATKLMRLLRRAIPHLEIVLVSSGPEKQARFGLPEGVSLYEFHSYKEQASSRHRHIDLVVSAPGIFDHCRSQSAVLAVLGLPEDTPFIFMAEYGSMRQLRDDAFKAHTARIETLVDTHLDQLAARDGHDPDTLGYRSTSGEVVSVVGGEVTSLGHLREALAANRPDNPLWDWLTQPSLSARSAGFDVGEMGIFIEDELQPPNDVGTVDKQLLLTDLQDEVLSTLLVPGEAEGNSNSKARALYSGYAHSSQSFFIDYVAAIECSRHRPIDIVIPNARTASDAYQAIFSDALLERLKDAGIGCVTVVGNSASDVQDLERFSHELGVGKELRCVTRYPLPHADMRTLLRASESATMVSGDQSFSESVSARKEFVVIEPVYCQTFHLDAQLALAQRVNPELRLVLEFAMKFKWDQDDWIKVNDALSSGRLAGYFSSFNDIVHTEHRLNERIVSVVKRALLSAHRPSVRAALRDIFSDGFEAFASGRGFIARQAQIESLAALLA